MKFSSRNFQYESISDSDINDTYIGWLNDPKVNAFLSARTQIQTRRSVLEYIELLREHPGCDLLTIKSRVDLLHVGNLSITPNNDPGVGTYGLMIGLNSSTLGAVAAIESSIAILDFIFGYCNKRLDQQLVDIRNVKAYKIIKYLRFSLVDNETNPLIHKFQITNDDWINSRHIFNYVTNPITLY